MFDLKNKVAIITGSRRGSVNPRFTGLFSSRRVENV